MSSSSAVPESALRSRIVFGTAALGMAYGLPREGAASASGISFEEAALLVEHALAAGITTFDTAPAYGDSEARLGKILRGRGRVWTKVASGDPAASLRISLERLERSSVDLLQWHNWTAALARDGSWCGAWNALRSSPSVRALGATTYGATDALAAVESGLFDVVQVEYNVLNASVINAIRERTAGRVRVAVRSVYLQGALTTEGRALPPLPELAAGVARARELAGARGLTYLALRSALESSAIDHVLLGFDRRAQVEEALVIADAAPMPADMARAIRTLDLDGSPATDPRQWPR